MTTTGNIENRKLTVVQRVKINLEPMEEQFEEHILPKLWRECVSEMLASTGGDVFLERRGDDLFLADSWELVVRAPDFLPRERTTYVSDILRHLLRYPVCIPGPTVLDALLGNTHLIPQRWEEYGREGFEFFGRRLDTLKYPSHLNITKYGIIKAYAHVSGFRRLHLVGPKGNTHWAEDEYPCITSSDFVWTYGLNSRKALIVCYKVSQ